MDAAEVAKHNGMQSCWIVVNSKVYDVTSFVDEHPGGPSLILKYAGADASEAFNEVHTQQTLDEHMTQGQCLGKLTGNPSALAQPKKSTTGNTGSENEIPPIVSMVMTHDFEPVAKALLSDRAFTYVHSFSSLEDRINSYHRTWSSLSFRPRVMRNVEHVNSTRCMLSHQSRFPFFIAPMGLAGSMHSDAERVVARGAAQKATHYCVSTSATLTHDVIMESFRTAQAESNMRDRSQLFLQLYVNSNQKITQDFLRRARALGYKGLFITVDTHILGKRIQDRRLQSRELIEAGITERPVGNLVSDGKDGKAKDGRPQTGGRSRPGVISQALNWDDLKWIRKEWDGPIVLKGIQSAADAKMAYDTGCQGIYLSNHGGRQLQDAPSSLETLLEIRSMAPEILGRMEIYCDGSFRTGADILKALCLGATSVAVGRPFMYAAAVYGVKGIERVIDILADEIEITMKLLGVTDLKQLSPDLVRVPHELRMSSRL
ncbi:mitochondrial cytochrome-like protein b2 [Rhizodiscina lignyota]|uniref:Mitochondrial cytochrome-like protein b2 n=1 Tax=Rhizodiscina lignyota TaxID=1504668 RepID=A0A9P4I7Q8_9PEZI|nr:mitochondrial cytochrome-like protein b2 [Rhizodiscina lignyota]